MCSDHSALPARAEDQTAGLSHSLTSSLSVSPGAVQIPEGTGPTSGLPSSPSDASTTKGSASADRSSGSLQGSPSPSVVSTSLPSCGLLPDEGQQLSLDSLLPMHNGSIK